MLCMEIGIFNLQNRWFEQLIFHIVWPAVRSGSVRWMHNCIRWIAQHIRRRERGFSLLLASSGDHEDYPRVLVWEPLRHLPRMLFRHWQWASRFHHQHQTPRHSHLMIDQKSPLWLNTMKRYWQIKNGDDVLVLKGNPLRFLRHLVYIYMCVYGFRSQLEDQKKPHLSFTWSRIVPRMPPAEETSAYFHTPLLYTPMHTWQGLR